MNANLIEAGKVVKVRELAELGQTPRQQADAVGRSTRWVEAAHLIWERLCPLAKQAFRDGRLNFIAAHRLAGETDAAQAFIITESLLTPIRVPPMRRRRGRFLIVGDSERAEVREGDKVLEVFDNATTTDTHEKNAWNRALKWAEDNQ